MTTTSPTRWLRISVTPQPGEIVEALPLVMEALNRRNIPHDATVVCGHILYPLWPMPAVGGTFDLLLQYRLMNGGDQ